MSRKDFNLIASTIAECELTYEQRDSLAREFANKLASTNPNFNRSRFIAACHNSLVQSRDY